MLIQLHQWWYGHSPPAHWSVSSVQCNCKLVWPHKLQWFVISNFKNYMFAHCWVSSLLLIGSWYRNISLWLITLLDSTFWLLFFLYFIKLLIESIHPFSKGVDCVSKWHCWRPYQLLAWGTSHSLGQAIELYQN